MQLIDYRDSRPIFEQIVDNYKMQILTGVLAPDEQLPSVRTLATELSANPNTIQKAYAVLEREGYIYTVKGKGAFVHGDERLKEDKKKELAERLRALLSEAKAVGMSADDLLTLALPENSALDKDISRRQIREDYRSQELKQASA